MEIDDQIDTLRAQKMRPENSPYVVQKIQGYIDKLSQQQREYHRQLAAMRNNELEMQDNIQELELIRLQAKESESRRDKVKQFNIMVKEQMEEAITKIMEYNQGQMEQISQKLGLKPECRDYVSSDGKAMEEIDEKSFYDKLAEQN